MNGVSRGRQAGAVMFSAGVVLLAAAASGCQADPPRESDASARAGLFVPASARQVAHNERDGIRQVSYELDVTHPAATFLCELQGYLDRQQWRGLREQASHAGTPSSLVRGWTDFVETANPPPTHVHVWTAQWLNDPGDLLTHALRYEYPEGAAPRFASAKVTSLFVPAATAQAQHGPRLEQLRQQLLPLKAPCATP